jgi:type VI secretion system protein ImpM
MPDEVLTPEEDRRPVAGFFGKLPTTGDFVWRGLPDAFRKRWDAWLTHNVAPLHREGRALPPGGLRFRLPSGGRLAAGVILPSQDSAGRLFPLSLLLIAEGDLTPTQIDLWCDAALELPVSDLTADSLWLSLDALPAPEPIGSASGALQLWAPDRPAEETDAADPTEALRQLLSG